MRINNPVTRWSLVNRLVLGVVILSTIGFAASDIAAQKMLRGYLVHQIDDQLNNVVKGSLDRILRSGVAPRERDEDEDDEDEDDEERGRERRALPLPPLQSLPTSTSLTLINTKGEVVGAIGGDLSPTNFADYISGITQEGFEDRGQAPFTFESNEAKFRVIVQELPNNAGLILVAQSLDDMQRTLNRLQLLFILIGGVLILVIGFASRAVVKIGLRPLVEVEKTAGKIAGGDLSVRLPDSKPGTEVGRLVNSLNSMLSRIEGSFAARAESENKLRRFVADASHELRTPITAIRGFAELHRQGAVADGVPTKELLGRIEGESKRMGSLVEDLLLLARLDQSREMENKPVDLTKLVKDAVASAQVAGPQHPVHFKEPRGELFILGDADRIHQVVANLLANARAHTPAGTKIDVALSQSEDGISLSVADNGPGLSEEHQEHIFERFFRADPSRKRTDGEGSGLGLSIVDAVMRAHGGRVSVNSKLGEGATFTLFFPRKD